MNSEHTTMNLGLGRRMKLMKMAQKLGYVTYYREEEVGNLSSLFRAIADGHVRLVAVDGRVLTDGDLEYEVCHG
jgi:hypothetical protein